MEISFVPYSDLFLKKSWDWLNDSEIKKLTNTHDFTKEDQKRFFNSLKSRNDYLIKGIIFNKIPIGACGLKNITNSDAEYWGYIGEKEFWGKGFGKEILDFMINCGIKMNLSSIYLNVIKENKRAIKLYQNFGFETEELTDFGFKMRLKL